MKTRALALLGGDPVRNKDYPPHSTIIDDAEKEEVIEVLEGGQLSEKARAQVGYPRLLLG
jgi:hypothetical protein